MRKVKYSEPDLRTGKLIADLAELRAVIEEDDDDENVYFEGEDDMDDVDMDDMDEMYDFDGDEDEEDEYLDMDDMDEDEDDDDFGDGYNDEDEDEQIWTSPAEFAGVDLITPRRSYKGAKNMETVKDCEWGDLRLLG